MGILVDENTRVIIQGITGREAASMSREMLSYGTNVVAGVTPGKGGESVHGVPVYDGVREAVAAHNADASLVLVPAVFAKDAVMEAADNGIGLIVVPTERIPRRDAVEMLAFAADRGARVIGPNTGGVITVGQSRLGIFGGSNPERSFTPGPVGIISRSGGMTTEIANLLTQQGIGQSTAIGMGGDPIVGSTYNDFLDLFERDGKTKAVALFCEPGGVKEEAAADYIGERFSKPVVAFVAGRFVDDIPGARFGHASVIVQPGSGSVEKKVARFKQAGVHVVDVYSEVATKLKELLG